MENQINYYPIIKDVITGFFTLVGLIIAGMGLATWKKQIKGTKNFEVSYNLHFSVLKLRNAIKHVRNPAIFPSETERAIQYSKNKYPEKSQEEIESKKVSYVYEMRWEKISEAYTEIESHLLSAELLWGKEILDLVRQLNKKVTELNINLQQYFNPDLRTKDYNEIHDIVYDQSNPQTGTEDDFSKEISLMIENIANFLKDKMK